MAAGAKRSQRRVLWVEGKDDSAVTQSLCEAHGIPEVFRVEAKNGVDDVLGNFFAILRAPGAERFGVVVDADRDARVRWESIRHTLLDEGYVHVPEVLDLSGVIVAETPHRPRFGAWIMPDNVSPGALEEFVAELVPSLDPLWARAGATIDAIPAEHRKFPDVRRSKARMHTWLAWQESPGSPMGQAIGKGDLRADAPAAQRFVAWLRRLMVDGAAS